LRHLVALMVALAGFGYALLLICQSDGFYHDDDITHYYFAAQGWSDGQALWHQWARPGYNVPAAVVAVMRVFPPLPYSCMSKTSG
jgi:hypothetical protein